MERKNSILIPSLQSGSHTLDLSPLQKRREEKIKNKVGSSLPSGSIYGLWILGMVSNGQPWKAKRLRGEGLLVRSRLRSSFKVAS
jgi:hypothetical protein